MAYNRSVALYILQEARELIADPAHWTQEVEARDEYGNPCHCLRRDARSFCMLGAIHRVAAGDEHGNRLIRIFGGYTRISQMNDTATHEEVLAHMDYMIKTIKGRT